MKAAFSSELQISDGGSWQARREHLNIWGDQLLFQHFPLERSGTFLVFLEACFFRRVFASSTLKYPRNRLRELRVLRSQTGACQRVVAPSLFAFDNVLRKTTFFYACLQKEWNSASDKLGGK